MKKTKFLNNLEVQIEKEVNPPMSILEELALPKAMHCFIENLKTDVDFRRVWKDNIAMSFKDEVARYKKKTKRSSLNSTEIHVLANEAASNFLTLLCTK